MRFIRFLFVAALAIVLLVLALANRSAVTVKAFPANFDQYLGENWQITLPLFMVILMSVLLGIVLGLIWEWLREAHIRSESSRRARNVARLEREVGSLRDQHNAPKDDVLAILDQPKKMASSDGRIGPGPNLPAPR
ncbi:MAG: LapA family protein [Paracoccus sp. (in: a-proteobacteria)]